MIYGIDTSFDEVSLDEALRLKAAGVQVAWQCLWTGGRQPPSRVINLRSYQQAGLYVMGYTSLPDNCRAGQGAYHFSMGRQGVPPDLWNALFRVVIDVELPGIQQAAVREALEAAAAASKLRTVYTSYHAWVDLMGNPSTFADADLINAFWDGDPTDKDFLQYPYGGWALDNVIGEQYTGGQDVEGVYADRDVFWVDLGRLLGRQADDPRIGLLQLRIAILEAAARGGLEGDGQLLVNAGKVIGGKC